MGLLSPGKLSEEQVARVGAALSPMGPDAKVVMITYDDVTYVILFDGHSDTGRAVASNLVKAGNEVNEEDLEWFAKSAAQFHGIPFEKE